MVDLLAGVLRTPTSACATVYLLPTTYHVHGNWLTLDSQGVSNPAEPLGLAVDKGATALIDAVHGVRNLTLSMQKARQASVSDF